MNETPHNFSNGLDLLENALETQIYQKLIQQLQKDFDLANVDCDFAGNILPIELQQRLQEKLYLLLLEKFNDYLNLLYVIDVPEKEFKNIETSNIFEVAKYVSFLVLKREWQKVWFKNKYQG